ncbi:MAG TPA: hypothetical protein VGO47_02710 [Chlamydiales bacterium]|nr:hypothetical protein [Chlamydiales bacterium]
MSYYLNGERPLSLYLPRFLLVIFLFFNTRRISANCVFIFRLGHPVQRVSNTFLLISALNTDFHVCRPEWDQGFPECSQNVSTYDDVGSQNSNDHWDQAARYTDMGFVGGLSGYGVSYRTPYLLLTIFSFSTVAAGGFQASHHTVAQPQTYAPRFDAQPYVLSLNRVLSTHLIAVSFNSDMAGYVPQHQAEATFSGTG